MHLFFQPVQDYLFPYFPEILCSVISSFYKQLMHRYENLMSKNALSSFDKIKWTKFQKDLSVQVAQPLICEYLCLGPVPKLADW